MNYVWTIEEEFMEGLALVVIIAIIIIAQVISMKKRNDAARDKQSDQDRRTMSPQATAKQGTISMSDYIQQPAPTKGIAATAALRPSTPQTTGQSEPRSTTYSFSHHERMTSEELEHEDYNYDYTVNKLGMVVRKRRGTFIEGSPEAYMIIHGTHDHYGKDKGR
jgi:hypothetical protein